MKQKMTTQTLNIILMPTRVLQGSKLKQVLFKVIKSFHNNKVFSAFVKCHQLH